jgi:hypothetical protein
LPQHELPAAQHTPPQHTLPDGQQEPLQQVAPDGHAVSQLPQLLVSVPVSTQLPRQLVRPTGHCVQGPEETVQPWFWNCTHDTQSLWDREDPETSRHWKPLHQTWAEYGNVLVGTPTLRAGNCCCTQDVASDWVNATAVRTATTHDELSSTYTVIGTGMTQLPLLQRRSPEHDWGQTVLQLPQFWTSVATSLQRPPQQRLPAGQVVVQAPQAAGSEARLRQVPPQSVSPGGQTQTPPWQILPPVHTLPQLPQLLVSLVWFVLVLAQTVGNCGGQTQTPPWQIRRPVHTLPQLPQFWSSVARLRQVPPQSVRPGGQTQTPPWQILPPVQTLPQLPQLFGSVAGLRQAPLQHNPPGAHATPQAPQLDGSLASVRHVPPQLVWADGQQMLPAPPGEQCRFWGHPNASAHSAMIRRRQLAKATPMRPLQASSAVQSSNS